MGDVERSLIYRSSEFNADKYEIDLDLFKDNYDTLKELSEELLEKESLDETEIDAIVYKNKI